MRATGYHGARPRASSANRALVELADLLLDFGRHLEEPQTHALAARERGSDAHGHHLHTHGEIAPRRVDVDVQREAGPELERVGRLHEHAPAREVGHEAAAEIAIG